MQADDSGPTLAQGLVRLGTLLAVTAIGGYFLWSLFSENAALKRLATTAKTFVTRKVVMSKGAPSPLAYPTALI